MDFTSNIPQQYKFVFKTEADKVIHGRRGVYAYYENSESCYLCFIIGTNGKHSRLNLGSVENAGDMLHDVLVSLPKKPFIKADLNKILEARIVENRQPVKACIDILVHIGYVDVLPKNKKLQYYTLTQKGTLAQKSPKRPRETP